MVTAMDVLNAINLLLVKRYPDRTVYVQRCPKNFARPSFFLELIRQDAESANKGLLAETMYFLLTCFASKDEYYNSDALELIQLQNDVLNLFRSGYLGVGDREIKIEASGGGTEKGEVYIDIQVDFAQEKSEETAELPYMQNVDVKLKEECITWDYQV